MRTMLVVCVVLALSACVGPCKDRSGNYSLKYATRSGDCTPPAEAIVQPSATVGAADGCVNKTTASADNCRISMDITCSDASGSIAVVGPVDWSSDGSSGHGVVDIRITGSGSCHGTYDMTYTRL